LLLKQGDVSKSSRAFLRQTTTLGLRLSLILSGLLQELPLGAMNINPQPNPND
jgi:hypothetical protein